MKTLTVKDCYKVPVFLMVIIATSAMLHLTVFQTYLENRHFYFSIMFFSSFHVVILYLVSYFIVRAIFRDRMPVFKIFLEIALVFGATYVAAPYYYDYIPCGEQLSEGIIENRGKEIGINELTNILEENNYDSIGKKAGVFIISTKIEQNSSYTYLAEYSHFIFPFDACQILKIYKVKKPLLDKLPFVAKKNLGIE